jgi:hypothetical protein
MPHARFVVAAVAVGIGSVASLPAAFGGPPEPRHIPADASFVLHIDVEAANHSTIMRHLMTTDGEVPPMFEDLRAIAAEMGIDFLKDMHGVTAWARSAEGAMESGPEAFVAVASPAFDGVLEKLRAAEHGYSSLTVDGYDLHRWEQGCGFMRPIDDGRRRLIVVGQTPAQVTSALAVIDGRSPSKSEADRPRLMPGTVIFAHAAGLPTIDESADRDGFDPSAVINKTRSMVTQIGEDQGQVFLHLLADTATKDDADDVVDIVQALLVIGRTITKKDPQLEPVEDFLRAIRISSSGAKVELELRMDAEAFPVEQLGEIADG